MIYSDFHRLTKEECAIDHAWEAQTQSQPRSQDRWYSNLHTLSSHHPPPSYVRTSMWKEILLSWHGICGNAINLLAVLHGICLETHLSTFFWELYARQRLCFWHVT